MNSFQYFRLSNKIFTEYITNLKNKIELLLLDDFWRWPNGFQRDWEEVPETPSIGQRLSLWSASRAITGPLTANPSVLTCLGNDIGYEAIFSEQLKTLGKSDDLLLVFSGSGNSPDGVEAIKTARTLSISSYAVLGFSPPDSRTPGIR